MMTSDNFNALGYHEKTEAVLKGTYVADLNDYHYTKLCNLDSFYVEVFRKQKGE